MDTKKRIITILLLSIIPFKSYSQNVLNVGSKRELFIDKHLIDTISDLELKLNHPQEIKSTNIPNGYYQTIIKTDSLYRIYFRDQLDFWKEKMKCLKLTLIVNQS